MHYLLFYEKVVDHAAREAPWQAAHRAHVLAAVARGELLLGGPLFAPENGDNLLLFQGELPFVAEQFARNDPYVLQGIVSRWHVRPWETVVGPQAAHPILG